MIQMVKSTLQFLKQRYIFPSSEKAARFLDTYPFLVPLLEEAHSKIEDYFGPRTQVRLEVVSDREAHGLIEMFGYIAVPFTPETAGERLQQFDREWFLGQIDRAKGLLTFDVEFR
jgi:hypothetical protein